MSDAIAGTQVVTRTIKLLQLVSQRAGGSLIADLVAKSNLTRPTVYRLMSALESAGLVEQDASSKRWFLGPESYVLGMLAAPRFNVERVARGLLRRIADRTGDCTFLSVRRGLECVYLIREEGAFPIRTHVLQVGHRLPLGVGSAGIAILATLNDEEIDSVIDANRQVVSRRYPGYSVNLMLELVAEARQAGYAVNRGHLLAGSMGISAAVRDGNGLPIAALSLAAIESRLPPGRQVEMGALLIREAEDLSDLLLKPPQIKGDPSTKVA